MNQTILKNEEKLKLMNRIYSFIKAEHKKVNDSIFTILGKEFHENTISNYLAYILNPNINGIGITPLQNVLDLLDSDFQLTDDDLIEIHREYALLTNRRVDFLIKINNETIIAIEHKVLSKEHGDQTNDYVKLIHREFAHLRDQIYFIFLTPKGTKPLSNQFAPISYEQLLSALRKVTVDYLKDIRKAVLFHEFTFHLEEQFMKNESITLSKQSMLYLDYYDMIQDLHKQFVSDYHSIFNYMKSIITSYFVEEIGDNWEFDFKEDRGYHKIYKPTWKENGLDIHFELSMNLNSLSSKSIKFMLDIEGSEKKSFEKKYDVLLNQHLENHSSTGKIKYRLNNRKDTFAHKTYPILTSDLLQDEVQFREQIIQIINDFSCLIQPIDEAILDFIKNK